MTSSNEIEEFLSGNLRGEQLSNFREKLKNDEDLLEKVSIRAVQLHGRNQLVKKLNDVHEQVAQEKRNVRFYLVAAAMLVVLGIPLLLNLVSGNSENEELFSTYFEAPSHTPIEKYQKENPFYYGFENYSQGNYQEAINNFSVNKPKSDEIHFYLGISYIAGDAKDPSKALEEFNTISNQSQYFSDLKWYKSLSFILLDSIKQAKVSLNEVIESNPERAQEAQELLEKI